MPDMLVKLCDLPPLEPANSTSPTNAMPRSLDANTTWPGVWPGQCSTSNAISPTVTTSP